MSRTFSGVMYNLSLWFLVSILAWPVFVAVCAGLSLWVGEGSIINSLSLEPGSKLMMEFFEGFRESAIITIPLGFVAVVDYQLFSRHRLTWLIAGLSLPAACIGIALYFYHEPFPLLPPFAITGAVLFVLYRLSDKLRRAY